MQHMQTTCKSNAINATNAQHLGGGPPKRGAAAFGRRPPFLGPSFVHLLHLLRCFYMLFACVAFVLHFIYILFASLLGMMGQLLRQWLLSRMLWMLYYIILYIILYNIILYYILYDIILYIILYDINIILYCI